MEEKTFLDNIDLWVYVILAIIAIWILVSVWNYVEKNFRKLIRRKRTDDRRDSIRAFTKKQREAGMERCTHRCEGTGLFFRCRYEGNDLHGDHWFPHARGGATSLKNLVMLCPTCNKRKSAKIPSYAQTLALIIRRKVGWNYSNPTAKVGEWLPYSYRQEVKEPVGKKPSWDFPM